MEKIPRLDLYAAAALQGLLANPAIKGYTMEDYTNHAYAIAKDMVDLLNSASRKAEAEITCNHTLNQAEND